MPAAITRRPSPAMADAELTHIAPVPIDIARADAQHAAYRAALIGTGLALVDLPALAGHPDCAFVEDVAVCLPEVVIRCRPGAVSRRGEVSAIAGALPMDRRVATIDAPGTIDGGDVLVIAKDIYIGRSTRTDAAAIAAVTCIVEPHGYRVHSVPMASALHLKTAVTALADDLLLLNPGWVDATLFGGRRHVAVAAGEPFAANSLRIGDALLYPAAYPQTAARIEAVGLAITGLDISEFAKAEAGLTCLSLIVPPAA